MSKYCPTCGNTLDDDAVFCANCGSSMAPAETPDYDAPVAKKPAKKALNVKLIAIIVAAVVVVGAVVAWLLIANPFADPTEPLKDYYAYRYAEELSLADERGLAAGLSDDNLKKIYNIYAETKQYNGYKDNGYEVKGEEENWKDRIDGYKESMGKDWSYTYKVGEKYKAPDINAEQAESSFFSTGLSMLRQVENLRDLDEDEIENIADYMDIEVADVESLLDAIEALANDMLKANVSEVYVITYTASRSGKELDEEKEDLDSYTSMSVFKVNGKWISGEGLNLVENRVENILDLMESGASYEKDDN